MEGNRLRISSDGQIIFTSRDEQITDGVKELQTELKASSSSLDSQRSSQELEEKIFVAVGKEVKECKSVLMWALKNFPRSKFFLVHVHCPDKMIPMALGGKFPVSKLSDQQLASHRQLEREKMNKTLCQYLEICSRGKVQAGTLVIEMDDVANGLLTLIHNHHITDLVMGARNYSKRMKLPSSRKAKTVHEKAAPYCRISFVCKGNIICIREAHIHDSRSSSTSASASSAWSQESQLPVREVATPLRSRSEGTREILVSLPQDEELRTHSLSILRPTRMEASFGNSSSPLDEEVNTSVSPSAPKLDDLIESLYPLDAQEDIYIQLRESMAEGQSARRAAYEDYCRRVKAEKDALEANRKVMLLTNMHERESKQRKMAEEALAKEKREMEKLEAKNLDSLQKLWDTQEHRSALEAQLTQLEQNLSESQLLVSSLEKENQELRSSSSFSLLTPCFSIFSNEELGKATSGFDDSLKIGEGGYGIVYKGTLHHTTVAIKRLHSHGNQGQREFWQEVEVLRRVRHPNLVTLIGVCPEAWCLVYEYLPNGSLEDRLTCKDNSPPLPWQSRLRITADICSALIFLHSNKPHSIVHGDLKPANVLLDSGFVSKLGDFGLSRLLSHPSAFDSSSSFLCDFTDSPKGTIAYMDPEILVTGEITVGSDVYSLGVIILRLLTARRAQRIVRDVEEALECNSFHRMLDQSAGDWPFVQAKQLAHLALQCCAMTRKTRPNLITGVYRILEPMMNSALASPSPPLPLLSSGDHSPIPSYFLCPILKEVMKDPHVAADGCTYEGEAVREWFEGGNRTSPMTNLVLPHQQLTPNRALRSAIQDWLQRQVH